MFFSYSSSLIPISRKKKFSANLILKIFKNVNANILLNIKIIVKIKLKIILIKIFSFWLLNNLSNKNLLQIE